MSSQNTSDKLDLIFEKQEELARNFQPQELKNGFYTHPCLDLESPQDQMILKAYAWFTVEEIAEAMNELRNRPWKTTMKPVDVPHFKEELVDALHFFIELLQHAGMTADDVYIEYMKKASINQKRIDTGV